jgi:hypothetical protein
MHDDEADTALDEPARHQTPLRVGRRAVLFADRLGLFHHVERVHRGELHLERGLHRRDAAFEECVLTEAILMFAVQRLRQIELRALRIGVELGIPQKADHLVGRHFERVERAALELGRQKS